MADERERSPAQRVAGLITAHLPSAGEVVIAQVASAVAADLVALPDLLTPWLESRLADLVYNAVQVRVARSRSASAPRLVVVGAPETSREATSAGRAVQRRIDWLRWMEHVQDRHVPLGQMRRADLRAAANERLGRGHQELERGALWSALAERLGNDTLTVAEVFTNEEIDQLAAGVRVRSSWVIVEAAPPPPVTGLRAQHDAAAD